MLKAYTPATYRTVTEYELVFDDGRNNGFGFPCDRDGKLLESEDKNRELHENLKFCLAHPEKFDRFNEVVEYRRRIREAYRLNRDLIKATLSETETKIDVAFIYLSDKPAEYETISNKMRALLSGISDRIAAIEAERGNE